MKGPATPARAADRVRLLVVSFLGLGLSPVAPGTAGTLGGVLIAALIPASWDFRAAAGAAAAAVLLVGWPLGGWAERWSGRKDPGVFVLDEVAGYLIGVLPILPAGRPGTGTLLVGFFLFRAFDVLKPPPAARLERLRGGAGILLDDVVAGLYTNVILSLIRLIGP